MSLMCYVQIIFYCIATDGAFTHSCACADVRNDDNVDEVYVYVSPCNSC